MNSIAIDASFAVVARPKPTMNGTLASLDLDAVRIAFERDGYVILEGIFDGQDIDALRQAAADVTQRTRAGEWPHRRIVGKQFPPFDTVQSNDSWGVQHLMHPALAYHDTFAAFYASTPLLDVAAALLQADERQMQLELFNLLIEPQKHCFSLGWHRDDVRPDVDADEEQRRLDAPTHGVQWNACLYDDDCLFIVPGTHKRLRDAAEQKANLAVPPAARMYAGKHDQGFDGAWDIDPPNTLRVSLKAGQTVFYSQRILHRASYLPSRIRATLHGCYGEIKAATRKSPNEECDDDEAERISASERARNVLQHGVEWMRDPSFGESLPDRLKPMWNNLLRMSATNKAEDLGYSLDG